MLKVASLLRVACILHLMLVIGCAATPLKKSHHTDYDVIVVGGGLGGLSAAAHLETAGLDVLLLEQHDKVGGCTTSFSRGEFNFDVALHEMSMGGGTGLIKMLLEKAGVIDKIELIRIPTTGRTMLPGIDFAHPESPEEFTKLFSQKWPEEAENIKEFSKVIKDMNEEVLKLRGLYLSNPLKAIFTKLTIPFRMRTLAKYRNDTVEDILDQFFENEELKATIAMMWVYYGAPPSKQWGIFHFIASYSYMSNGAWQIKGSSQALSNAYRDRIVELGGTVKTGNKVTKIILDDSKRTRGVEVESGESYTSRYVVSNADPFQTFFTLIGEDKTPPRLAKKIRSMKPSNSLAGVYIGLDVEPSFWGIEDYEIFYSPSLDSDKVYDNMMSGDFKQGAVTVTFYSALNDPFYAPEGKSVMVIDTYSDISTWPERGPEYYKVKEEMINDLIAIVEKNIMPGLSDHIEVKVGMTPRTIQHFTMSHNGIPYGWDILPEQQERLELEVSKIPGLYLAGSWAWPSHSVAMTQLSGFMAAEMIKKRDELD